MNYSAALIILAASAKTAFAAVTGSQTPQELQLRAAKYREQSRHVREGLEGYLFLYFTGNTEQIFLAASKGNDAVTFTALNEGLPVLISSAGDQGVRDPYVIRSVEGDKFFILATDLCTRCGTSWDEAVRHGSQYLEIWETKDFVTFSEQRHVLVSPENFGNTWAPESYYDQELHTYVVYWASAIYDQATDPNHEAAQYQRLMYATTDDFVTFSEPVVWQDEGPAGRIDSTVIAADGLYHRFTKATIDGCADIVQESSPSLTATLEDWDLIATCIGKNAGTRNVEGPSIFKTNPGDVNGERYVLLVDEYSSGTGYLPLESTDVGSGNWTKAAQFSYPPGPRHGTIIPVTASELEAVIAGWAI
ncbi:hypothetical protein HJFPF1_10444 [Paramyrothecium foliicola]|nr:hypothetical protein HJFPF1_10444 [Paramyrothecium foliicola]